METLKVEKLVCKKCGQLKSVSEFYKSAKAKSGYQSYCKECEKEISRVAQRLKTKEPVRKITERFADVQDRELIAELRARGWSGKLLFTVRKEVQV